MGKKACYLPFAVGIGGIFLAFTGAFGDTRTDIEDANKTLDTPLLSVIQSLIVAPSYDRHDYITLSTYAWPNPSTPDGLPYISKDGQTNPETDKYPDRKNLERMVKAVRQLVKGYSAEHDERYAHKAIELVNVWFLNSETQMNPNLNYAQIVPGKNNGLGNASGLIETHTFVDLIESLSKLEDAYPVPVETKDGMRAWFKQYLNWLQNSPNGREGEKARNNQLTWLTAQKVAIAEFIGDQERAKTLLENFVSNRLPEQITPEGAQPEELKRTKSFNYSLVNLQGLFALARLADNIHIDLWHYKMSTGAGLEKALDFLISYATGEKIWPYKEIHPYDVFLLKSVLNQAVKAYPENRKLYEYVIFNHKVF